MQMKTKVVCYIDEPSPIAYYDLYDEGDEWIKIKGCQECPPESRRLCCGQCPFLMDYECAWNRDRSKNKPFTCIVKPYPSSAMSFCALEYLCVKGPKEGKIRRVQDPGNTFVDNIKKC